MKQIKALIILITVSLPFFSYSKEIKYPYCSILENIKVCSDISLEFSKHHAKHAFRTWNYYKKIFKNSPGSRIELYYTSNENKFKDELKQYPTTIIKGGRQLTAFWDNDHRIWYIIPYTQPDFGTQLHEISHDFLYFTFPKSIEYPWFKEGSGMYYESGYLDSNDNFKIISPNKVYLEYFLKYNQNNELIELNKLITMKSDIFYKTDFTKTYSQSLMFYYYLMNNYKDIMDKLYEKINSEEINSNESLIKYLLSATKKNIYEMDKEYREYSERLKY